MTNTELDTLAEQAGFAFVDSYGNLCSSFVEDACMRDEVKVFARLIAERCAVITERAGGLDATLGAQAIRDAFK